jgi:riboflavin-specific deaminase-like protein
MKPVDDEGTPHAPSAGLWQAMLRARTESTLPPDAVLQRDARGWHLHTHADDADRAAFALYKPLLDAATERGREHPWLLAQLGQSLDGCIATHSGDSCFVTGEASLQHLHRLRALCDAVLVGAGTVAADDPQLTTRRVAGANPARWLLDPSARLDGRARVFHDGQAPTWWVCDEHSAAQAHARLAAAGGGAAQVLAVAGLAEAQAGPARLLQALQHAGHRCVLVEGGGVTVSRLLAAGCLDRLHLVVAPVLIGAGRPGLQLPPQHALMRGCPRPPSRVFTLGEDLLWDLDLQALRGAGLSATAAR